jgi:hypothetical protein
MMLQGVRQFYNQGGISPYPLSPLAQSCYFSLSNSPASAFSIVYQVLIGQVTEKIWRFGLPLPTPAHCQSFCWVCFGVSFSRLSSLM